MGQPITWRNVETPRIDDSIRAINSAQWGINTGFNNLADVLKQREATDTANWNQQKQNNTQAFLDEVAKYRTPEEYQAALASGAIDQVRQGFGAQIDANAARAAEESRLATLQQRVTAGNAFEDSQRQRTEATDVDRITQLALTDPAAAQAALAAAPVKFKAALQKAITDSARQKTLQGYEDTRQTWAGNDEARKADMAPLERAVKEAQAKESAARITGINAQANRDNAAAEKERADATSTGPNMKRQQAALDAVIKSGTGSAGYLGNKEGDDTLQEFILKHADKGDIPLINEELSQLKRTGIKDKDGNSLPIPVAYAINAIMGMGSRGWTGRWGNQVSDKLTADVLANKDTVIQDYAAINQLRSNIVNKGIPGGSQKTDSSASTAAPSNEQPATPNLPKPTGSPVQGKPAQPEDTEATRIASARKKLTEAFAATQADIRKSGGIDNITETQRKELQRISQGMSALDDQEAAIKDRLTKTLSERRRLADQEEARGKKPLGYQ